MAIMGTVVIEDLSIQFRIHNAEEVEYTITDGLTGEEETKVVNASAFAAALEIALNPVEGLKVSDAELEEAMPFSPSLRFIP